MVQRPDGTHPAALATPHHENSNLWPAAIMAIGANTRLVASTQNDLKAWKIIAWTWASSTAGAFIGTG